MTKDFTVKIADFGQAIQYPDNDLINKTHGTYQFMSPECVAGIFYLARGSFSGKAAELWALGVTIYSFIFRALPYEGENLHDLMQNIENNPYLLFRIKFPNSPYISNELKRILERLLDRNSETRITIQQLLQDPWINS